MGDFKRTRPTPDLAEEREARIRSGAGTVKKLAGTEAGYKTQNISAKVDPEVWLAFKRINRARGMSNNSVINMLMTDYIKHSSNLLEE